MHHAMAKQLNQKKKKKKKEAASLVIGCAVDLTLSCDLLYLSFGLLI